MDVILLGTGGSIPTTGRMHPSILVEHQGCQVLMDTGEGTQIQLERAGVGMNKRMAILITHLHADHVLGLPGILLRFSLLGRTRPLDIYGPQELLDFVRAGQATIHLGTTFESTVYAIQGGYTTKLGELEMRAFEVAHRGFALGYELTHQRPTGQFIPRKAEDLGVTRGPLWKTLSSGMAVTLEDGRVIRPEDVTRPRPMPVKIVYSGDTRPCDELRKAAVSADLLICEAMYASDYGDLAVERGHMTGAEAAQLALEAHAKCLVLTHLSPRYDLHKGSPVLDEAQAVFHNTLLAHDLMKLTVDSRGVRAVSPDDARSQ